MRTSFLLSSCVVVAFSMGCVNEGTSNQTFARQKARPAARAGTAAPGCSCDGTGPGDTPVTANCGESACGSDYTLYSCSAAGWSWTGQDCGRDAGADTTCQCNGTGPGDAPVTASCGESACGSDYTLYSCSAAGWSWTGQDCGRDAGADSSCTCNGTGPGGTAVTASCGESACGSDYTLYSCSAAGWSYTGTGCGRDGGTDVSCTCNGTGPGGAAVTATCGQTACGSDYVDYNCTTDGWVWTGQSCMPTQLAFSVQPASGWTKTPMTKLVVEVRDSAGKRATWSTAQVALALDANPGGASLMGFTTVTAVAGQATFETVGLDQPGTGYTFVASSPGLVSAESVAFDVRQPPFARVSTGFWGGGVNSVAIGGGPNPVAYAATPAAVFRSRNGGSTWEPANFGNPGGAGLLAIDPNDSATAYITLQQGGMINGSGGGLSFGKTTNAGDAWRALRLPNDMPGAIVIDPSNPAILYAGGSSGVYRSANAGQSWEKTGFPFACLKLTIDPVTPSTLYGYARDVVAQQPMGVYKTIDSGASWFPVNNPALTTSDLAIQQLTATPTGVFLSSSLGSSNLYRSTDGGATWNLVLSSGRVIAYAPSQTSRVYVGIRNMVFVSDDGGTTFRDGGICPGAINVTSPYSLAVDPADPNHLFAATDRGVFVSVNGAVNWSASSTGIEAVDLSAVVMSPTSPDTIVASSRTQGRGTYRTTNGGNTWNHVANSSMHALAVEPSHADTMYGCGPTARFYRSTDAGLTWDSGVDMGGGAYYCYSILVRGQDIWVPTAGAGVAAGLRHSADGGATWSSALDASSYAVAADSTGDTLYVQTNVSKYKSVDRGAHWTELVGASQPLLVDPMNPLIVYGSCSRSTDGGETWNPPICMLRFDIGYPFSLLRLLALPNGTILGVTGTQVIPGVGGGLFTSTSDHGLTWRQGGGTGIVGTPASLAATDDGQTVWVGTDLGLFKSTTGGF